MELQGTNTRKPQQGPLQGLKVLDLTRLLPGPLGTMIMADMGAEVIKIEAPNFKDYTRDFPPHMGGESAGYLAFNRSKRSLALDYATPEGKAVLMDLVKEADIFVEQFRPGKLTKMGLDYDSLKAMNPQLIYVSVTGYGQTGPYANLAGHDLNYITLAGLLGGNQNSAPQMPTVQIADIAGGSYMTIIACLSAVFARQQTGKGQFVDVALMDGSMPLNWNPASWFWATNDAQNREQGFLSGGLLNYGIYPCQDGRYIALGTLEAKFWNKFCEVVEKPDWKNRMFPTKPETFRQYKEELTVLFQSQPAEYWHKLGMEHDVLINLIYDINEVEQDPQVKAREMIVEMEHPKAGKIKGIGVPLKFSETEAKPAWTAPIFGEDTLAILQEANVSEETIKELAEKGILKMNKV